MKEERRKAWLLPAHFFFDNPELPREEIFWHRGDSLEKSTYDRLNYPLGLLMVTILLEDADFLDGESPALIRLYFLIKETTEILKKFPGKRKSEILKEGINKIYGEGAFSLLTEKMHAKVLGEEATYPQTEAVFEAAVTENFEDDSTSFLREKPFKPY